MAEFDAGAGGILGTNDLQQTVDTFKSAVDDLKSVVSNMATSMGNGLTSHPAMGMGAEGQTFTKGSMNATAAGGNGAWGTTSQNRGAVILGGGSGSPPTMGQTAAGGGANGGGATFGGSGGGPGGPGGPPGPGSPPPAGGWGAAMGAARSAGSWAVNAGMGQFSNQLLYNAYGQQIAAQWGGNAQNSQNAAFGNTMGLVNAAAMGNAQSAASEFGTLNQMAGGVNVTHTAAFGATNALAFANQGMGAAAAANLSAQIYNPARSLQMMQLTGVSAINPATGKQNSLSSIIGGLANENYLGGGGYNSKTGTFKQTAMNASFTAGRGTSWMNLQSLGYNPSQIQDIQSVMTEANQAAIKGHTSFQSVMGLMNQAQYGSAAGIESADSRLKGMGVNLSTIQKQGNLSSMGMAQQQSTSSTYNEAVSGFTTAMTRATQAVNWFLDHTGLNKAIGGVSGAGAGYSSTGMSGWVHGITGTLGSIASMAGIGGGAASVSATQSMTAQGSTPGSTMSSGVSGQVTTAVRDAEAQVGKPYVFGGDKPSTSFDCSGLVMWSYDQAGVHLPRTSQEQWAALKNKSVALSQVREGDVVFQAGSDGTFAQPGHEAMMISNSQIVEAPFTGANIRIRGYNPGEWQHAGRPVGASGGSSVTPVSGASTGSALAAGNAGVGMAGNGGDEDLNIVANADDMLWAGGAGGGAGSPSGGSNAGNTSASSGSGGGSPAGIGTSGGANANGRQIYDYLKQNLFGGNSIAAAGAAASIWGESSWNPFAVGTGGRGLIGWTPPSKISDSTFKGGMKTQLPAILDFVKSSGDMGAIAQMRRASTVYQAAEEWGRGVERYGIDDVHATGVHLAGQIAGLPSSKWGMSTGGSFLAGERGPEMVTVASGQSANIMSAKQTADLISGRSAQSAQAPWTATPGQQLLLDTMTPANSYAQGANGGVTISVTVEQGAITMGGGGSGGNSSTDVQSMANAFGQAVENRMARSELIRNIAKGVT